MTRKSWLTVLSAVAVFTLLAWVRSAAFAFVPACTEEVALNYPPILRADLSACQAALEPKPEPKVDLKAFVARLDGTWVLQSRTVQGITVEGQSRYHIEIDQVNGKGALGSAALLECVDPHCEQTRVAGAWTLDLSSTPDRIALNTAGKILMPSGKTEALTAANDEATKSRFFEQSGVYVSINDEAGPRLGEERRWDRVVLTERTLTYISCRDGRVDRFVKTSPSPLVQGKPVKDVLKRVQVGWLMKGGR